ncbi:MAG TPA: CPBP family intramembrane glutamic endopeptidase [Terriglobales bacterium]|nr:CPBP family intramembrane glutamic endopeptidase [Terriglobales bacterium]
MNRRIKVKSILLSTREWIKKRPVGTFFLLAIAISFGTLFPAIYLVPRDNTLGQIIGYYIERIGIFSPVLAGVFVTKIIQPGRKSVSFLHRLKISFPVWLIAMVIHIANLKLTAPPNVPITGLIMLSLPVALLPAWIISSAFSGSDGIKNMLATLVKPRGKILYYLLALFTFPIITLAGNLITNIVNGLPLFPEVKQGTNLIYTTIITFFSVLVFTGGLNEESGWRGFAQKRLQSKYSPLASALLLWFSMVIWHIPNDLIQYQNGGYFMIRIVLYLLITILFSWTFNRTKGSILSVALFHASMNSMNPLMGVFPITTAGNVILIAFAIIVVVFDRMWSRLPKEHPAVYRETRL